jgi:hypothetical protein
MFPSPVVPVVPVARRVAARVVPVLTPQVGVVAWAVMPVTAATAAAVSMVLPVLIR